MEGPTRTSKYLSQKSPATKTNRVFIIQNSPSRSTSKEKYESVATQQSVQGSNHQSSHRSNLDRLATLILKSRNNTKSLGQSGCEKLVKVIDRVLRTKCLKEQALQKLKRYCLLCSSTSYQLFVQSKHQQYLLKQIMPKVKHEEQMPDINEASIRSSRTSVMRSFKEGNKHFNQSFSPYYKLSGPLEFKSKQNVQTCSSFRSQQSLHQVRSNRPVNFKPFKIGGIKNMNLWELPLKRSIMRSQQALFLHLAHLPNQQITAHLPTPIDQIQIPKMQQIQAQQKHNISKEIPLKLNISPKISNQGNQCKSINKIKGSKVLSSKQIADKMLFGQCKQVRLAKVDMVQVKRENTKRRVSSLPKITFTYSSEKDRKLQQKDTIKKPTNGSNNFNNAQTKPSNLGIEAQSTFGSTKDAVNLYKIGSPSFKKSPKIASKPILNFPPQKITSKIISPAHRISHDYYAKVDNKAQGHKQKRERLMSQVPFLGKQIEYVGAQKQQVQCCILQKNSLSKSLNARVLSFYRF